MSENPSAKASSSGKRLVLPVRVKSTRAALEQLRRKDPAFYHELGDVAQALLDLAGADTWFEAKRVVERSPGLLTAGADVALERLAASESAHGDPLLSRYFLELRQLLGLCQSEGIDAAFQLLATSIMERSPEAMRRWLEAAEENPSLYWDLIPIIEGVLEVERDEGAKDQETNALQAFLLNELGLAYHALPLGDRTANTERAIACLQEALRYYSRESKSESYAVLLANLGITHRSLQAGDVVENLKEAIAYYLKALSVYTSVYTADAMPQGYADVQSNLGNAYADLSDLGMKANLGQAIACYKEALRVLSPEKDVIRYARTLSSLGLAYTDLPDADAEPNLREAMNCYEQALRLVTAETAPLEYGSIQINLAKLYTKLSWNEHSRNVAQAIACYQKALGVFTPELPAMHMKVARSLGKLYFREHEFGNAHVAYVAAITDSETLYRASDTEVARQVELADAIVTLSDDSYCLARLGQFAQAVERLEATRSRALAEALSQDRAPLEVAHPEDRKAFKVAQNHVRELEEESRTLNTADHSLVAARHFASISSELRTARHTLTEVVKRIQHYAPEFGAAGIDFPAIAAAAAPGNPLVYLCTTSQGSLALIVPPEANTLDSQHIVWLDRLRFDDLFGMLFQMDADQKTFTGYLSYLITGDLPRFRAMLDELLPLLREHLTGPLVARLGELGFQQATLIPGVFWAYCPCTLPVILSLFPLRRRRVSSRCPPTLLGRGLTFRPFYWALGILCLAHVPCPSPALKSKWLRVSLTRTPGACSTSIKPRAQTCWSNWQVPSTFTSPATGSSGWKHRSTLPST